MTCELKTAVAGFLEHRRALGRKYLELKRQSFGRCCACRTARGEPPRPAHYRPARRLPGPRPRTRPRSFNHLLGVVADLLDWALTQQMLDAVPVLRPRRRRVTAAALPFLFDITQARRLLDAAAALPDNLGRGRAPRANPPHRVRAVLRARAARREAGCGWPTWTSTVLCSWCAAASSARPAWSRTDRASARCCAHSWTLNRSSGRRGGRPVVFTGGGMHPGTARCSITSSPISTFLSTGSARRGCTRCAFLGGRVPAALVSRRPRSGSAAVAAVHVHGARRSHIDRGLPVITPGCSPRPTAASRRSPNRAWLQAAP